MLVLSERFDLGEFYSRLERARERVLLLDYDGTLAPFRIRPEQAQPYPGVVDLLSALNARPDTRVVIVSGRRADEIAALLPAGACPEIWGAHGWERLVPGGQVIAEEPADVVKSALAEADARAAAFRSSGARIEAKPASIALHWRGLPVLSVARLREQTEAAWRPLAAGGALEWLPFDGGVELRAREASKRRAVDAILDETGAGVPVAYLGDDATDEDAFEALKGRGVSVLVRPEYRPTAADLWLRPPHELLAFLGRWRSRSASR